MDAVGNTKFVRSIAVLDVLRGLAAIYVLTGHARWLLWEGYSEGYVHHSEAYGFFDTILVYFFSVFRFGHQAVMLFFVLSGFVIHYSTYQQSLKSGAFSIRNYVFKRFKRIYPPVLFALALTWILDSIGSYFGYSIYTGQTGYSSINKAIFSDMSWTTLFGNLAMVQSIYTPVWGSNGPLWSLTYEWWFYMLYIPVFFLNKKTPLITAYVICISIALSLAIPASAGRWLLILQYFFSWYFGVIAADVYTGRIKGTAVICSLISTIVLVQIWGIYMQGLNGCMKDTLLAFLFALGMYVVLLYDRKMKMPGFLQSISSYSYTLYVIHLPILVLFSGWLQNRNQGILPMTFSYVFSAMIACIFIAWVVHFLVERPFMKKREIDKR